LWLIDLANELHAAIQEGTLPKLSLDRIWIRSDGCLVLLDFPATGVSSDPSFESAAENRAPVQLLSAVANFCLSEPVSPNSVPLRVRSMIGRWTDSAAPDFPEARAGLLDLLTGPAQVTKWRRGLVVGMSALPFLFSLALPIGLILAFGALMPPDRGEMLSLLQSLGDDSPPASAHRSAIEIYLAGRHGALLRDNAYWGSLQAPEWAYGEWHKRAADVALRHPSVSAAEVAQAEIVIAPELEKIRRRQDPAMQVAQTAAAMGLILGAIIAICSLILSVFLPGGPLLRAAGLAAVNREGKEIGRLRSAVRVLVTWSPAIVIGIGQHYYGVITRQNPFQIAPWWLAGATLVPLTIGALWTILHPEQGLHDRVTGTWVVPR
jgi:hypothetical protein